MQGIAQRVQGMYLQLDCPEWMSGSDFSNFLIDPRLRAEIGNRKAVLWNAHFRFDAELWSTFDFLGGGIFEIFEEQPHLFLLFRPHPLLWKQLNNMGVLDRAGVHAFKRELIARGVIIDERPDHRHVFAASAAMLSDVGSFLLEYLVTEKPVFYWKIQTG
ncbi:hypothetical protein [Castellaniella sp.]|uniref:hypothetical protein n=1 Tax=Castellaniella sp. TaxID=1955812 RepID=UPI002AFE634E|nr:hypothetical protein [Castellaniella sp.]